MRRPPADGSVRRRPGARIARGVRGPVGAQVGHQVVGALGGEEQPAAVDGHHIGDAGNGVTQPVRVAQAEEDIAGPPGYERRHREPFQCGADRGQVAVAQ